MIKVSNLSKSFKVFKKSVGLKASIKSLFHREYTENFALNNVNLEIPQGQIIGLVGANGAGKTTLIKILTGIISATSGTAEVLDFNPWDRKYAFRKSISLIMGQKAQLWWDLPAEDCFILLRDIYDIPQKQYQDSLDKLTTMLDVKKQLNIQIRRLSLGERMKMEIIATLLHNPKVIFLDEPTIGLDLTSQKAIRNFLLNYRKECNATIVLTSHYMEDIEALCERVVILRKGEIVFDGKTSEINSLDSTKIISFKLKQGSSKEEILKSIALLSSDDFIDSNEDTYKVRVEKTAFKQVLNSLISNFEVEDLLVEEDDISVMIEKIMKGGIRA